MEHHADVIMTEPTNPSVAKRKKVLSYIGLACLTLLAGLAWLPFIPSGLEGLDFFIWILVAILPSVFFWLIALYSGKSPSITGSLKTRKSYTVWAVAVLFFTVLFLYVQHETVARALYEPEIIFSWLVHWQNYILYITISSWVIGVVWLVMLRNRGYWLLVTGFMTIIILGGVVLPANISIYITSRVATAPLWKTQPLSESLCVSLLSRDRYDCYQALGANQKDVKLCSNSRPDLSCARPFALQSDYSFCNSQLLVNGNPLGWHPGEVELMSGGPSVYKQKFTLSDTDLVQIYCVAGLLHQQWRVDCDWMFGEIVSICRAEEKEKACNYLKGSTQVACKEALSGPGLFTDNWFGKNFQIWDEPLKFYSGGTQVESLGYLKIPVNAQARSVSFDTDTQLEGITIKRIDYYSDLPYNQGEDGAMFFAAVSGSSTFEALEARSEYRPSAKTMLSEGDITFLGQPAKLKAYGDSNSYPVKVSARVVEFSYKDVRYMLVFNSPRRSVDWESFIKLMSLSEKWQ